MRGSLQPSILPLPIRRRVAPCYLRDCSHSDIVFEGSSIGSLGDDTVMVIYLRLVCLSNSFRSSTRFRQRRSWAFRFLEELFDIVAISVDGCL